ncbi:MAG: hypothetical protein UY85_C0001G0013 [Candidatus Peribacteria bacterium GW2011_GWB1_54_5]|nr:MAG: hypothetical protein UY85_C0001G0013 [Candidatus Peribacteria bacterium GW2011_GWB1_54_5]
MPQNGAPVSNWVESLLRQEIKGVCPKCGKYESDQSGSFTNHHINGVPSISEYWNLIRLCRGCHDKCENHRGEARYERDIKRMKANLFRDFLGHTTYDLLLRAYEKESVLTFPYIARTLLQLGLGTLTQENPGTFGAAQDKPTFSVYSLTEQGKKWAGELNLSWGETEQST